MIPCILETETQLRLARNEIKRLSAAASARSSPGADKLALLLKLVRDYEEAQLALACPDPLAAIRLRMRERRGNTS